MLQAQDVDTGFKGRCHLIKFFFFWIVWSCRVKLCVSLNYPKSSHNHNLFSSLVASALFCTKLPCDPRVCKRRDQLAKWMPSSLFWPIPTWISSLSRGSSRCTQALAPVEEVEGDPADRTLGSWRRWKTWLRLTPSAKGWQPLLNSGWKYSSSLCFILFCLVLWQHWSALK